MKKFNYRMVIEGDIVAEDEEEGKVLLVQAMKQYVLHVSPGRVEAVVIEGDLPPLSEAGTGGEVPVALDLIAKVGEVLSAGMDRMAEKITQALLASNARAIRLADPGDAPPAPEKQALASRLEADPEPEPAPVGRGRFKKTKAVVLAEPEEEQEA